MHNNTSLVPNNSSSVASVGKEVAMYKVICAWCKGLMAIKTCSDPNMDGQESHSICESCKKEVLGE